MLESCPNLTSANFWNCKNIQGNIQVLKSCPNLASVDFSFCVKIEGSIQVLKSCPNLTSVNFYECQHITGELGAKEFPGVFFCAPVRMFAEISLFSLFDIYFDN